MINLCPQVRAAGVGLAVALTSCEAGRLMVTSHTKHVPGGVWGAALSVLMDPSECSIVCQQVGWVCQEGGIMGARSFKL